MQRFVLFTFLMVMIMGSASTAEAQQYRCTRWSKQPNITCTHADRRSFVWARQCENPCSQWNTGARCDQVRLCLDQDPNEMQGHCSEWRRERSSNCYNPSTARWEQKWVRACQIGLATVWCSDTDPNR